MTTHPDTRPWTGAPRPTDVGKRCPRCARWWPDDFDEQCPGCDVTDGFDKEDR